MMQATFVMEQHLGHRTFYQNLRRFVDQQAAASFGAEAFVPRWVEVTYVQPGDIYERLRFLPASLAGTLRGRAQVRAGLRDAPAVVDATPPHASAPKRAAVAFFNTQVPAVLGGGATRRQPYVISTDITPIQYDRMGQHYGHTADRAGPLRAYKHWVNRRVFGGAAAVLPWSTWVRQSLIADYDVSPGRIEVIPPGVDLELWQPDAGRATLAPLRILFVGGDMHRKGGDILLQAYQALRAAGLAAAFELHLVTRSPAPSGDGVVAHHGLRPNTPELIAVFRASDVFVLPTEAEAFGIAAVEAAAAGLPAIVTDVGGLTDVVAEGETGYLIRPGDVQTLVARLGLLASDPGLRLRLGRAARARAEARFDARKNAARIVEILRAAAV
jgi:glycosyltransferase involved in cell wall biosynthesis